MSSPHHAVLPSSSTPRPSYSAVLTGPATSSPGGYTSSDNSPAPQVQTPQLSSASTIQGHHVLADLQTAREQCNSVTISYVLYVYVCMYHVI